MEHQASYRTSMISSISSVVGVDYSKDLSLAVVIPGFEVNQAFEAFLVTVGVKVMKTWEANQEVMKNFHSVEEVLVKKTWVANQEVMQDFRFAEVVPVVVEILVI